ncbi:MAG: hypothetical protein Q7V05_06525 [Methanoregula sp.]|nr:hypothetical protein [Methanoregula sp.]
MTDIRKMTGFVHRKDKPRKNRLFSQNTRDFRGKNCSENRYESYDVRGILPGVKSPGHTKSQRVFFVHAFMHEQ